MYIDDSIAKLKQFEDCIGWMYLDDDVPGNVTVGVGCLLATPGRALLLPFVKDGEIASALEVMAEFKRVAAMKPGQRAEFYRGDITLPPDAIEAELRKRLTAVDSVLRNAVAGFDDLPKSVKLALLDMAFNLGVTELLHGYPHLIQAVNDRNWQAAEAQCYRHGPGMVRNDWTRQCFQDAA